MRYQLSDISLYIIFVAFWNTAISQPSMLAHSVEHTSAMQSSPTEENDTYLETNIRNFWENMLAGVYETLSIESQFLTIELQIQYHNSSKLNFENLTPKLSHLLNNISHTLHLNKIATLELGVQVFSDRDEFYDHQIQKLGKVISPVGYFHAKNNEIVIYLTQNTTYNMSVLLHEITHAISYYHFNKLPLWLNEGLAELFARQALRPDTPPSQLVNHYIISFKQFNKQTLLQDDFFNVSTKSFGAKSKQLNHLFYEKSLSLIAYLMSHDQGKRLLLILLKSMKKNVEAIYFSERLIDEHYPGGMKTLLNNWHIWLQHILIYRNNTE